MAKTRFLLPLVIMYEIILVKDGDLKVMVSDSP